MTFIPVAVDPATEQFYAHRIEAGVAFLDQRFPGWAERIDMETLDMTDPENCILGQLAPTNYCIFVYGEGVDAHNLGFDGPHMAKAQRLWEAEILKRL